MQPTKKKEYTKPVLETTQVELGVFGSYCEDGGHGGRRGGRGGRGSRGGRGGRGGWGILAGWPFDD